ncbi:MAG: recombination protein RecR [Alphaproteobacteria bacterium]|nr:recombination protein RecR [Alphaproteobacteria bacterium]
MNNNFSQHSETALDRLVKRLARLPGLGSRSAKRIALHMLLNRKDVMEPLAEALQETARDMKTCHHCFSIDTSDPCRICTDTSRSENTICVVASVADLWALERTRSFRGQYHVLGGLLSAIDGMGPRELNIDALLGRIQGEKVEEIILALSATVQGQSTAHYIADACNGLPVTVTRLAQGMPFGGELDYLDDGTITTALNARKAV